MDMQQFTRKNLIETYGLLLIDIVCIIISYMLALYLRFGTVGEQYARNFHYTIGLYLILACTLYNLFVNANNNFIQRGYYVEFIAITKYIIVSVLMVIAVLYLTKEGQNFSRIVIAYFGIFDLAFTYISHILFKKYLLIFYRKGNNSSKVMIITDSNHAKTVMENVLHDKAWNYEITAITVMDENKVGEKICGIDVVACSGNLFDVAKLILLDEVFIYLPNEDMPKIKEMIINFENMGVVCHYNVDIIDLHSSEQTVGKFAGYAVVSFSLKYMDFRRLLIKRLIDILGSLVGLLLTALITPFVALAIKLESKGPVFFSQIRIGKNGRRFKIYKFRSMYMDAEEKKKALLEQNEMDGLMFKMEDDPRVTKVGKFIRKTSIDELPQFYNILIGDMSLVGTRPPTVDEFEKYNLNYRRRLSITPGLTGMWQVNGRSNVLSFDEVVKYDLEYIDNWSLRLDFKILLQTVGVVLFRKGAK